MEQIYKKLEEYKSLLDFNNEDKKKDFKGNFKFIQWAVKKMIKNKEIEIDIIKFIQDAIDIHTRTYNVYLNQI
jgi:hypothetical protein